MKVKFNVNLGTRDAQALGLEADKCTKDSVHDLKAETVEALKKLGEFVVSEVDKAATAEKK